MSRLELPSPAAARSLRVGDRVLLWGERTYLMGILNVTPDSFSGDGLLGSIAAAVKKAEQAELEGADLLDLGGESTRPGFVPVPVHEELRRVLPVLQALRGAVTIPISIDTSKAAVAVAAVEAGAALVNDVSGLRDPALAGAVAALGVPLVVMAGGLRRPDSVVAGVMEELEALLSTARAAGVRSDQLIADPGFGFGKTPAANLALLAGMSALRGLGRPILAGLSKKRTIAAVLGEGTQQSASANAALSALAVAAGADILRVHDVRATREAARLADAVVRRPPAPGRPTSS